MGEGGRSQPLLHDPPQLVTGHPPVDATAVDAPAADALGGFVKHAASASAESAQQRGDDHQYPQT